MSSTVDVTVVVPCYNGQRYLDQCLSSVECNTRVSLEVLCVNDGSRDGSLDIMRAHAARDARVRVIDKPNSGYGASVNRGFREARGRYVAIVECDDYVKPHFYDDAVSFADAFPDRPEIVKTPYVRVVLPDTPRERRLHCKYYGLARDLGRTFALHEQPVLVHYHPSVWSAIYDRAFLEDRGIGMREVPGAGWVDNPFLFETMLQARRIAYLDREYYCYREDAPGSSSVVRDPRTVIDRWNDMQDIVERLGVVDRAVLDSHIWHAFAFVEPFAREALARDGQLARDVRALFARIRPELVWGNKFVSNPLKELYAAATGIEEPPAWDRGAHLRQMAREVAQGIRHNGPGFVGAYLDAFLYARAARRDVVTDSRAPRDEAGL